LSDLPAEFRTVLQLVSYLDYLAGCMKQVLGKSGHCVTRITRSDLEVVEQAGGMLRMAIEPVSHISRGNRDPRELRYSTRDVEAMMDVVLSLQRHKNLQRLEKYRRTIKATANGWIHEHHFETTEDGHSTCWCGASIGIAGHS
jgi:hypothetical protein